jgi:hypothetical protein
MGYSPFGTDDSDLEDWIRQQAESGALDDLASPSPMQPLAAYQAPQHAEMAPLKLDTGPDWSDALGAGTTALAALADLGLNHGHGTGQILAAGGQFGQARAEQRLKGTQDALSYEQKRAELERQNNYNDYLYASLGHRADTAATNDAHKVTSEGLRGREVAVKEAGSGRADAKVERDTNADSGYADEFRNMLYDSGAVPRGKYDGASYEQMKADQPAAGRMWEFQHAGDKAAAQTTGRIGAELDAEPDTTAAAARKAAAEQAATQGGKLELVDETARAKAKADQDIAGDKQIGNADVADPNVWKNVSTKGYNDANDIAMSRATFKKAMDDMATIRARAGTQVVPSGDKTAYDSAQSAASSSLSTLFKTGVISEPEYRRYVDRIPNSGMSMGSVWGAATGQDVVGDQIAGTRDELLGIFDTGLRQYGLKPKGAGKPSAAADSLPPDRITGPVTDSFDVPGNLGVTGRPGVRNTPDFPGGMRRAGPGATPGPAGNADGVMMQSPSGNAGPVPPDKVSAAIAAGWKRL